MSHKKHQRQRFPIQRVVVSTYDGVAEIELLRDEPVDEDAPKKRNKPYNRAKMKAELLRQRG